MNYEQTTPKCTLKDLVLPDSVVTVIHELLEDYEYKEALLEEGMPVRRRILFHGPSGCGKTSIAHALAAELSMKLYAISLAQTVDDTVGGSAKQAESIFKFAAQNKCVMLIDEFDSLAVGRLQVKHSADQAHNHLVNSLLTNLEGREPLGLIVACTNLFDQLDPAVVRRFDVILEIPQASRTALLGIAKNVLKGRFGISPEEILEEASTPAAVVRVATDRVRRKVIEREKLNRAETIPLDQAEGFRKIRESIEKQTATPATA